ncbi:hypothetical protein [Aeromonas salmonicida]|uniref:hypothetical protein n=1 Tax=Aeromonas salmonicida TaxID=645 RepID=UPI000C1BD12F|nr:hypothetical protein [Aeromonas salmonicida]ATU98582.1 hypothetical protein CHQ57_14900 [Aeromonas salmonicida]MDM5067252.1 hypothetical protein [Aeromonas salmonicida]
MLIILLVAANFAALSLLGDKAELVAYLIGVVSGAVLNARNSVIAFFLVHSISHKHEGNVQLNINALR